MSRREITKTDEFWISGEIPTEGSGSGTSGRKKILRVLERLGRDMTTTAELLWGHVLSHLKCCGQDRNQWRSLCDIMSQRG